MNDTEMVREIQKGLLRWYAFKAGSKALYIGDEGAPLAECMAECGLEVVCIAIEDTFSAEWARTHQGTFDYLVSITDLEKNEEPQEVLSLWKTLLKADGHMLLGMNNRLGLRYFCGDRDCYTGRNLDGIENYRRVYSRKEDTFQGRMYDRHTLGKMLRESGLSTFQFYSVLSDLGNPALLYAEDYLPNEDLSNRVFPTYNCPDTVFLDEEPLYGQMIDNGMFHQTANAYLIECAMDGTLSDVVHVTASLERGREDALLTLIRRSGIVEKRAVYSEGIAGLEAMVEHIQDLKVHGLQVVEAEIKDNVCRMPYIKAQVGQMYLKQLLLSDKEKFLEAMDHFRDLIMQSSEIEKTDEGDGEGVILKRAYLDLVPLNSFYIDGEFIFYDQEFCEEHYPANVLLFRMISSFYAGNMQLEAIIPRTELFDRYGLTPNLQRWQKMEGEFLHDLLNKKELQIYHEKCRRNAEITDANRRRMNYTEAEYQRLFMDIFKGVEGKKLILFGSGTYTRHFLGLYKKEYPVYAIIDNNMDKWGQEMEDIRIQSPDILTKIPADEYKVLVCVKNYLSIIKQLRDAGVKYYSIFDPSKAYPHKANSVVTGINKNDKPKKYHIGYVAGVFDMFHVGHLNLLRRAKEQCDYLVVGVVSDEGVYRKKKKHPVISCEDRLEILRSCRYVDQAEELPTGFDSVRNAYKLFRFDCQFTGTDYADNPDWLADKEYLERQGADILFFPYTEKVSSTQLRETLKKRND